MQDSTFHRSNRTVISFHTHENGQKTEIQSAQNSNCNVENIIKDALNPSADIHIQHQRKHGEALYDPIINFLTTKIPKNLEGLEGLRNRLIERCVSMPNNHCIVQHMLNIRIKNVISLKDEKLNKLARKITATGLYDSVTIHRIFLLCNIYGFYIKDIKKYAPTLIKEILQSPLQYEHILESHMPFCIDTKHPENNIKNQLSLLLQNTDFNCNQQKKDVMKEENAQKTIRLPLFVDVLEGLKNNKGVDSFPIIQEWLNHKVDPNAQVLIKIKSVGKRPIACQGKNSFKQFIDLWRDKSICCSNPKKIIELFLEKKADVHRKCVDLTMLNNPTKLTLEGSPYAAFIYDVQFRDKPWFNFQDTADIIKLFMGEKFESEKCEIGGGIVCIGGGFTESSFSKLKDTLNIAQYILDKNSRVINKLIYSYKMIEDLKIAYPSRGEMYSQQQAELKNWIVKLLKHSMTPYFFCCRNEYPYEYILSKNPSQDQIEISNILLDATVDAVRSQLINQEQKRKIITWLMCLKSLEGEMPKSLIKIISVIAWGINVQDIENFAHTLRDAKEDQWYLDGVKRNNLRDFITQKLRRWDIDNAEFGSWISGYEWK